jgi:hypothetical protein
MTYYTISMKTLNVQKTALAVGIFLGGFHTLWAILIALGLAQSIYDFILWAHMIHLLITIGPFDGTAALTLVIFTFLTGYMFGYAFALIWNKLHSK